MIRATPTSRIRKNGSVERSPLSIDTLFAEHERLAQLRGETESAHQTFLQKIDEQLKIAQQKIAAIKIEHQGEKGERGRDGRDGLPGKNGRDAVAKDGIPGKDGAPGRDGRDGIDGKSPTLKEITEYLKKNLKFKDIPGLEGEMATYRQQLAGKIYGKDTWARGGGDTIEAGANITIVKTNGVKKISAAGGTGYTSGSGAPATTPSAIGAGYIDTDTGNIYIANGTSSSANWKLIANL